MEPLILIETAIIHTKAIQYWMTNFEGTRFIPEVYP